jgi:hypothetical protein
MTDDIPRKFLSDHMFLTSSFMVYRKIKNCDKFGTTKSDKLDKIILKVPMSKYVAIILRTENVHFGVLSQHFCWQKVMWKHNNHHKRFQTLRTPEDNVKKKRNVVKSETCLCDQTFSLSLDSLQLTRDADVQFYTGLSNTNVSKTLFDHLIPKASVMHYWKGPRQTLKETPMRYSMDGDPNIFWNQVQVEYWNLNYNCCWSWCVWG